MTSYQFLMTQFTFRHFKQNIYLDLVLAFQYLKAVATTILLHNILRSHIHFARLFEATTVIGRKAVFLFSKLEHSGYVTQSLPVCVCVCGWMGLSLSLSGWLAGCLCLCVCLSLSVSVCLSVCLSVSLSLSSLPLSVWLALSLSVSLSLFASHACVRVCVCARARVCMCVCARACVRACVCVCPSARRREGGLYKLTQTSNSICPILFSFPRSTLQDPYIQLLALALLPPPARVGRPVRHCQNQTIHAHKPAHTPSSAFRHLPPRGNSLSPRSCPPTRFGH